MADQDGVAVVEEVAVAAEPTADGPQGVKREREEEDVGATESKRAAAGDEAPQVSRSPLQGQPPPPCLPPKINASVTSTTMDTSTMAAAAKAYSRHYILKSFPLQPQASTALITTKT